MVELYPPLIRCIGVDHKGPEPHWLKLMPDTVLGCLAKSELHQKPRGLCSLSILLHA